MVKVKQFKVWKHGKVVETPYPGFYAGITTQKVFGRLDCGGGKLANKENRVFFHFWEDAIEAGFRPCKNCKPAKFARNECDHMPFGLTGGLALVLKDTRGKRVLINCALCEKLLGYGQKTNQGRIRWHDGFIAPHDKLIAANL